VSPIKRKTQFEDLREDGGKKKFGSERGSFMTHDAWRSGRVLYGIP
jgi:hypothetical protein